VAPTASETGIAEDTGLEPTLRRPGRGGRVGWGETAGLAGFNLVGVTAASSFLGPGRRAGMGKSCDSEDPKVALVSKALFN